jgi:hypothetical protein
MLSELFKYTAAVTKDLYEAADSTITAVVDDISAIPDAIEEGFDKGLFTGVDDSVDEVASELTDEETTKEPTPPSLFETR